MTESREKIISVFNMLHDAAICEADEVDSTLSLNIRLPCSVKYYKVRRYVTLILYGVSSLTFVTWPIRLGEPKCMLVSCKDIFQNRLNILESKLKNGFIEVVCNQVSTQSSFCGGELIFNAEDFLLCDDSGISLSVEQLEDLLERTLGRS